MKTQLRALSALTSIAAVTAFVLHVFSASPAPAAANGFQAEKEPRTEGALAPSITARADASISEDVVVVEDGGYYSAAPGSRFGFALVTDSEVNFGQTAEGRVGVALSGHLTTTVLDRRDDEIVVELRYDVTPTLLAGAEGAQEKMAKDFEHGVLVRMKSDGRVTGIRFSDVMGSRVRDTIRNLVGGFRLVARDDAEYESHDIEANGVAQLAYRWLDRDAGRLERTRVSLESHATFDEVGGAPLMTGMAKGVIDSNIGWRTEASFEDRMTGFSHEMLDVTAHGRGSLVLESAVNIGTASLPKVNWDADWDSMAVSGAIESDEGTLPFERRFWGEKLRNASVNFLVSRIEQVLSMEEYTLPMLIEAKTDLVWFLRLDPARVNEIEPLLGRVDPQVAQMMLGALGVVGDENCQSLLTSLAINHSQPEHIRTSSMFGMVEVNHPNTAMLDGLERIFTTTTSDGTRDTALLVAGALAGLTEEGDAVIDSLIDAQPSQGDEGLATWIVALGNTKSSAIATTVMNYLDHSDEAVRKAAQHALINTDPDAVAAVRAARG